jgi:hypothetical protein
MRYRRAYARLVRVRGRRTGRRPSFLVRSWAALLMFTAAGLLLLTAAVWARQEWVLPHTRAVVEDCRQITRIASRWYGGHKVVDDCRVTWPSAGGPQSSSLDLPTGRYRPGDTVSVVVTHGNAILPPPPQAMILLGVLVLLAATFGWWLLPPRPQHRRRIRP